jgi:N-methylhydantoinase A
VNRSLRVSGDIGGTFTDAVVYDPVAGAIFETKSSTTPDDFARGVFDALGLSGIDLTAIEQLIHGTTVVINAITQRSGVKTALLTTEGFRDALQIGRGNRPDMYNLRFHKPEPLVPRRLRFEVRERLLANGTIESPLDREQLVDLAERLRDERVAAVAICFLHSYAWPDHERQARDILVPLLPGVSITCSSDVCREWREFERTSTTVLNAYVHPILGRYLAELDAAFDEIEVTDRRLVMLSNGGSATFAFAREQPIQLVESGPAGGIAGALAIGALIDETHLITLDVGGTTAKCSVIVDGEAAISQDYRMEWTPWSPGYPLRIPVVDIVEIGAGGGSVVWFDDGGALRIGPRSAGADPGPACYGRGGTDPTITDAMVLAGILEPDSFLGGRLPIDPELSRIAFEPIAARLGLDISSTVSGVLRLFGELTVEALKLVSVRRGHDPRDFSLIAYGGGGPVHAGHLARELGVKQVIIPNFPGTFSAWGMLTSQPRIDLSRTLVLPLSDAPAKQRDEIFETIQREAETALSAQGFPLDRAMHQRAIDCRYRGQEHTVRVASVPGEDSAELEERFHHLHRQLYTFSLEQSEIELVNFRMTSTVAIEFAPIARSSSIDDAEDVARTATRFVAFPSGESCDVRIHQRAGVPSGFAGVGPAVIEEPSSATVVLPGQHFVFDHFGNIVIAEHQSNRKEPRHVERMSTLEDG